MKRVVLLIVAVPVLLFIVQNIQITELRFLVWRMAMPQALLLILVLAAGVLLGWVLHAALADRRKDDADLRPGAGE